MHKINPAHFSKMRCVFMTGQEAVVSSSSVVRREEAGKKLQKRKEREQERGGFSLTTCETVVVLCRLFLSGGLLCFSE